MPQKDDYTGELHQPQIILSMELIPHYQPAEVVKPSEQTFHFPTPLEATQLPAILGLVLRPTVLFVGRNDLGTELIEHLLVQPVAVVGLVANQTLGHIGHKTSFHRRRHQLHFSRASTLCAYGDRKTVAVRNRHEFAALPPLSFSHAEPPFFAGTKVPSMKHSRRSIPPRSLRSWATANSTSSSTLERTQFWNRRCTVWYGPYCGGRSCQRAPVRKIHRTPLSTVRRSLQGRPRRSARTRSGGKMVSTICHCSFVRSISP